jgi:hypothetical protein
MMDHTIREIEKIGQFLLYLANQETEANPHLIESVLLLSETVSHLEAYNQSLHKRTARERLGEIGRRMIVHGRRRRKESSDTEK